MGAPNLTAAVWRKSSRSNGGGGQCVEVAYVPGTAAVRDTKNRQGGALRFPRHTFDDFLAQTKTPGFTPN